MIYTHTHIDHYGGVKGVVDADDVSSGKVPIIAPGTITSFDKYAIGENVVAGNAISRRAGSLHNIQTLCGARGRTRDARNFARYLDETLERWGDEAEVHYGPHTWPVWGNENLVAFIESQRDTYKYVHDQTLRVANKGYTPAGGSRGDRAS